MGIIESLAKRFSRKAIVVNKQQITAQTYHISIKLQDSKALSYKPGEFLRLMVGLDQPAKLSEMLRTYSVWNYDAGSH
ncbi:hypothetical protein EHS13_31925 [Paenibacillus psychroresistens]|uniref:FAD-binding FR-type domain-containing protein n=1 Tax=Paenibacillus psychroresistens TaxID=1778678 RepID=A0A6B8RVJ9_9BACL|nr:hypothetical protein [Paenibacillus psychroresistens]QGQ99158.1 hypothetical protein EHS13_31925 [Paenibacillus psychroresistens]